MAASMADLARPSPQDEPLMTRDFQKPGRSPVLATEGMAATSHPLATQAALDMLKAGGTAADAAIAAVAVLGVVEPHMTGIGGDCFCLVARPGTKVWGYNGSGRAPQAIRASALIEQGLTSISLDSPHAVTVPGAVEAWAAILKAHGELGLDAVLQPAIRYAEQGFPVAPRVASDWAGEAARLARHAGAAAHYLPGGHAPAIGDRLSAPALARTLRAIAARGPSAFYTGEIAADIAATVKAAGGLLDEGDLAAHRGDVVEPISTRYRDIDVVELPPNGQGLAALVLLNMLETFDMASLDPTGPERYHLSLEAGRIAYALRDTHIADPSTMRVAVSSLLDKGFARKLAEKIDRAKKVPLPQAPTPGSDTVYLTVVDRDRMAVSLINSLYSAFGVGMATEKTGILLQNRGGCFVLDTDHPNCIGPGKRSMHTIIPALVMKGGRCVTSFGVMGGSYQAMGHAHAVCNMVDYGMDPQEALDLPRVFFEGERSVVERGVPQASADKLSAMGHTVAIPEKALGGGQAIAIDWERGVLTGGSDPRKDGCAGGY
jgi:gamma-glutamyltranspeptidase/glutathione hydrolase